MNSAICISQVKVELRLPLIQYQATNVDEIENGFVKDCISEYNIPNFEIKGYYNKFILGLNHYYSSKFNPVRNNSSGFKITNLTFYSVSILAGYTIKDKGKFAVSAGVGYNFYDNSIGYYMAGNPEELGSCIVEVRRKPNNFLIWNELSYKLFSKFHISVSGKFNPMFRSFPYAFENSIQDRLNLFSSQIMIGYIF